MENIGDRECKLQYENRKRCFKPPRRCSTTCQRNLSANEEKKKKIDKKTKKIYLLKKDKMRSNIFSDLLKKRINAIVAHVYMIMLYSCLNFAYE